MYRTKYAFSLMLAIMSLACGVAVPSPGWARSEIPEIVVDGEPVALAGVAGGNDSDPTYSPDGSQIAFSSIGPDHVPIADIYVMNADGTNPVNLTRSPHSDDEDPSWSPDGSKIAFNAGPYDQPYLSKIYVMNADGTNPINLSQYDAGGRLAWSPDSSKIAFTCEDPTAPGLYASDFILGICVVNVDGTNLVRLTPNFLPAYSPTWSPDGSMIAFEGYRSAGYPKSRVYQSFEIYVMNADGTNLVRLTETPDASFSRLPLWSPDGSKIAFLNDQYSDTNYSYALHVMNADGTYPTLVAGFTGSSYTWSPDGSKMASVQSGKIHVSELRYRGSLRATLLNLSPWQAWVHLYCLKDRAGSDADPCAVTFECNGQSGEPVAWPVTVAPKTIFSYWPNKTAPDGTDADLQAALMAAGKPEDEARRRTTCEVFSPDPLTVRGYTLFGGQPTLVPVAEPVRPDVSVAGIGSLDVRRRATLPNLSPGQAWVHLYCLRVREPRRPCAVTFECNGQSGEPVTWSVTVAPKTIFAYREYRLEEDDTDHSLEAALIAAGKPEDEARRRTTCEVFSRHAIAVRGYTRFGGQPTLVPVPAYPFSW